MVSASKLLVSNIIVCYNIGITGNKPVIKTRGKQMPEKVMVTQLTLIELHGGKSENEASIQKIWKHFRGTKYLGKITQIGDYCSLLSIEGLTTQEQEELKEFLKTL
jgi:hypothetical protein